MYRVMFTDHATKHRWKIADYATFKEAKDHLVVEKDKPCLEGTNRDLSMFSLIIKQNDVPKFSYRISKMRQ